MAHNFFFNACAYVGLTARRSSEACQASFWAGQKSPGNRASRFATIARTFSISLRADRTVAPPTPFFQRESVMTRHVKLDAATQQMFCAMVSVGCSVPRAAKLCGVTEGAIRYREKNDPQFREQYLNAKQIREITPLRQIKEAGGKSWRAAVWTLERLDPQEYGSRSKRVDSPNDVADMIERYVENALPESYEEVDDQRMENRRKSHVDESHRA